MIDQNGTGLARGWPQHPAHQLPPQPQAGRGPGDLQHRGFRYIQPLINHRAGAQHRDITSPEISKNAISNRQRSGAIDCFGWNASFLIHRRQLVRMRHAHTHSNGAQPVGIEPQEIRHHIAGDGNHLALEVGHQEITSSLFEPLGVNRPGGCKQLIPAQGTHGHQFISVRADHQGSEPTFITQALAIGAHRRGSQPQAPGRLQCLGHLRPAGGTCVVAFILQEGAALELAQVLQAAHHRWHHADRDLPIPTGNAAGCHHFNAHAGAQVGAQRLDDLDDDFLPVGHNHDALTAGNGQAGQFRHDHSFSGTRGGH